MSSQPNSSVYSEKKIAAYESLFKESSFAKPQEVYLTVTVAHLFGQAYVWEQQGTKEGEPIYQRFVCPLEDITKVYINDNVKASPLFIQCDTNIKGVVHRKRIIVPCLENVSSIVDQINEVRALHMEKYEAAQKREKERKLEAIEAAKSKKSESASKAKAAKAEEVAAAEAIPAEPASKAPSSRSKKAVSDPIIHTPENIKSVQELNDEVEASLKALESLENSFAENLGVKPITVTSTPEEKETAASKTKKAAVPVSEVPAPVFEEPAPIMETPAPVEEIPAPKVEAAPTVEIAPISEEKSVMTLEDFQTAAKKLKSMRDNGLVSEEEYAAEKKKLLANLY